MSRRLPFDPVAEARRQWVEHGWAEAAGGMAAVTSLMRAQQIVAARVEEALRPWALTFARYEVLMLLLLSRRGSLPMGRIGERLQVHPASVTNAVDRLEAQGFVRRTPHPTDRRATLVDFGLAKRMTDAEITDHGHVVGTYRYMSPEQARGEPLDRRSDLYSLGATLYELLAGRAPFTHRNQFELLEAIIYQEPPEIGRINPGAPAALARLAERLLQKNSEERPQNAAEVALLLRVIGRGVWGFSEPLMVPRPAEEKTG